MNESASLFDARFHICVIYYESALSITEKKFDTYLHFLSIFIAQ